MWDNKFGLGEFWDDLDVVRDLFFNKEGGVGLIEVFMDKFY